MGKQAVGAMTYPEPTPTAKGKRDALRRELESGRKIPAYKMIQLAGLQYSRALHELRWNVCGCVQPGRPKGLEYGLNIRNDSPDPRHPDHTVFWLEPGHWTKPVRITKTEKLVNRAVADAVDLDDVLDSRRTLEKLPAAMFSTGCLFGDLSALAPERHRDDG